MFSKRFACLQNRKNTFVKHFSPLLNERHTIGIVDSDKAIDLSVLDEMRSACDQVDTSSIIPVILDLRTELRKEGIVLSDRYGRQSSVILSIYLSVLYHLLLDR